MSIGRAGTGVRLAAAGGGRMCGYSSDLPSSHQAEEGRRRVGLGEGQRQGKT